MKFVCSKTNLVNGLQIVSKAVPGKTTMSILQCILIDTTTGVIKLVANDSELGIETLVEGNIVDRGIVAIDAKIFSDIVRKLPDNDVSVETQNTDGNIKVYISCENAKFTILGRGGEDFTYLPEMDRVDGIEISQYTLKNAIAQTIFAAGSINESNRMMSGELFCVNGNVLKLVTLDGHRIAIRNVELAKEYPSKKIVIPAKSLNEISKILSDSTESMVKIYSSDKNIMFEFDDTVVVARILEGDYFNVDQMLSSDYETKLTINRREFMNCIDRSTLLVKEGDKRPIIVAIDDSNLEIKINTALGSMDEKVRINKQGKDVQIGFNPKFLMDALRAIDDEEIDMYLVNPKAPCFIKDEKSSYIYLILPVNFATVR